MLQELQQKPSVVQENTLSIFMRNFIWIWNIIRTYTMRITSMNSYRILLWRFWMLPCFSFFLPWYYFIYTHFINRKIEKSYSKTNYLNISLYEIYKNCQCESSINELRWWLLLMTLQAVVLRWVTWLFNGLIGNIHKTKDTQITNAQSDNRTKEQISIVTKRHQTRRPLTHSCWETLLLIWSGVRAS